MAKETISEIDDRLTEIIQSKNGKKENWRNLAELQNCEKIPKSVYTTCTTGVPESRKRLVQKKYLKK